MDELIAPSHKRRKSNLTINRPPAADESQATWLEWIHQSELSVVALINVLGEDGEEPAVRFAKLVLFGEEPPNTPQHENMMVELFTPRALARRTNSSDQQLKCVSNDDHVSIKLDAIPVTVTTSL